MRWAHAQVPNSPVRNLQSRLYSDELSEYNYELEENPHITLVPGFDLKGDIDTPKISGDVGVRGYRFHPSERKPMVVMLDVSDSDVLSGAREELLDQIGRENVEFGLHPFHVTIFKAGDTGDEEQFSVPEEVADRIVSKCESHPSSLPIEDVVVDSWK